MSDRAPSVCIFLFLLLARLRVRDTQLKPREFDSREVWDFGRKWRWRSLEVHNPIPDFRLCCADTRRKIHFVIPWLQWARKPKICLYIRRISRCPKADTILPVVYSYWMVRPRCSGERSCVGRQILRALWGWVSILPEWLAWHRIGGLGWLHCLSY